MEQLTPKAVFDLFRQLSTEQKDGFLRMLAHLATPKVAFLIIENLSKEEQLKLTGKMYEQTVNKALPLVINEAWRIVRKKPSIEFEQFRIEVKEAVKNFVENAAVIVAEAVREEIKDQRDRKPDPEIARRNLEICELRKQNRTLWSLEKLAKKYGLTKRSISLIQKDEDKWRRLVHVEETSSSPGSDF